MKRRLLDARIASPLAALLILAACATSPTGRKQLMLLPEGQMAQLGAQSFQQLKSKTPVENDPAMNAYVKCVAVPITKSVTPDQLEVKSWEIVVFKDDTPNAFALPGGKIGVHTGLLKVAKTDAQLAAVLGHEVGHVIARHGNERVSQNVMAQAGLTAAQLFTQGQGSQKQGLIMAALGAGAQFGVLLPFSRAQESEADLIGLDLMSRAGFDPRQSVELWKNMMEVSGGKSPPEWMSTHPASSSRIDTLQENMGPALVKYEKTAARPTCRR